MSNEHATCFYELVVTLTNETAGHVFSEFNERLDEGEHFLLLDDDGKPDFGAIYRTAQAEYGVCRSSVYIENEGAPDRRIGWYFESRQRYEDTGEPYIRGAWVTVRKVRPALISYVAMV